MKKIFSLFTAALLSVSMFASLENPPSDQTLKGYAEAGQNLVYAIFVEDSIKCNDIVLVGTYNGWTGAAESCSKFVAVEGYAGWYVCCVTDASEDIQAKPVQLDGAGTFNWDYQVGKLEQEAVVRGTATIVPGYSNECDIKAISDAAPVLINVTSWKTNPCTAKFHDYKITLVSPDCNELEYITPAISGGFNSWAQDSMAFDATATEQRQKDQLPGAVYTFTARAAEGTQYKFRSAASWGADWTNELKEYDEAAGEWKAYNGGQNFTFDKSTNIEFDLGDATKYTWTNCERPTPVECDSMEYTITVKFPACDSVTQPQLMGSFKEGAWNEGINMSATGNLNEWTVSVRALCTSVYKFRDAGYEGWSNQVQEFSDPEWKDMGDTPFGEVAAITLDFSGANYKWTKCEAPTALNNVKAAKSAAKKMMVNGQMVIMVGESMYNVLGTEMK